MEQFVRYTCHTNALASIAEGLGAGNQQDVVIRIVGHRGLIGSFEGLGQILSEIHSKVGQVFHDDGIILGSQLAYRLQLTLRHTYPGRIVGIGVDDGADVALAEIAFQFVVQLVATIVVHIERLILYTLYLQLHLLYRETRVDEEHGIFFPVSLRAGKERGKRTLHAATHRYTTLRGYVYVDKSLDKAGCLLFQFRISLNVRIGMCDTALQSLDLGIDTHLSSGQAWYAHLHLDELNTALLLGHSCHLLHLTDGCLGKVLNAQLGYQPVDNRFLDRGFFHFFLLSITRQLDASSAFLIQTQPAQ